MAKQRRRQYDLDNAFPNINHVKCGETVGVRSINYILSVLSILLRVISSYRSRQPSNNET